MGMASESTLGFDIEGVRILVVERGTWDTE
jgi:hypothetical protein